ncbi:DMT family transporter [Caldovatus aquaticus]|uniref:DMT family transporter n=1 Tax=Caldovatus aquaticus TaxID=2865671 RepID=A0ABS7EX20_9PROT|nr:DMT family transporter [Caldovatus aquaticus]MBW8267902.1 DMT family transporter [Caldovatus aquaticus]
MASRDEARCASAPRAAVAPASLPPGRDRRVLLGILLMCAAGTLFPVMNGLVQVLSRTYPSEQIIWARNTGHLLVVLALIVPRYGLSVLRTVRPAAQLARSILLLMSTAMFFFGVKHIPLAQAGSISQMAPFFVTLLAWPLLGERIRPSRFVAVLVGFVGVLIVIRPGTDVFHWASLLIMGSAFCYALYQIFTRRVAGLDRPETSVMYSALVGTLVMCAVVPFVWKAPLSLADAVLHGCLGVLGASGHYCVARALTYAQANVIAPFQYWQIVGSVIVGWFVSGLLPDLGTWIGAGIIVAAGVYIALTASRAPRRG